MSLESIKSDFEDIYNKAKMFESLLPDNIQKPEVEIHSDNFYGEERIKHIRFMWKKGKIQFHSLLLSTSFKIIYINEETEAVDKRTITMASMNDFMRAIDVYLQLFKLNN